MKVDNRFTDSDNRTCGLRGIALSAKPVGDVLQGAAADCNSATENASFSHVFSTVSRSLKTDKNPRQTKNASETLTTAIWWLVPTAILGALIWGWGIVEVLG